MQVSSERLHLSPRIREMSITDSWRDDSPALDANLQAFEAFRDLLQRIVSPIQAVQTARVILFVEAFRAQEQVKVS